MKVKIDDVKPVEEIENAMPMVPRVCAYSDGSWRKIWFNDVKEFLDFVKISGGIVVKTFNIHVGLVYRVINLSNDLEAIYQVRDYYKCKRCQTERVEAFIGEHEIEIVCSHCGGGDLEFIERKVYVPLKV